MFWLYLLKAYRVFIIKPTRNGGCKTFGFKGVFFIAWSPEKGR